MSKNNNLISLIPDQELEKLLSNFKTLEKPDQQLLLSILANDKIKSKSLNYSTITDPDLRSKLCVAVLHANLPPTQAPLYFNCIYEIILNDKCDNLLKNYFSKDVESDIFKFFAQMSLIDSATGQIKFSFNDSTKLMILIAKLSTFSNDLNDFCIEYCCTQASKSFNYNATDCYISYNDNANLDAIFKKIFKHNEDCAMVFAEEYGLTKYLMLK